MVKINLKIIFILFLIAGIFPSFGIDAKVDPIRVAVEVNVGDSTMIKLSNGDSVKMVLLSVNEERDNLRGAIRSVSVKVSVDGQETMLRSGNYNLPQPVGKVLIDCPVTKGYYTNMNGDRWGLTKDARFRLWPVGSPCLNPGTFVYPVKATWLPGMSQSGNEPAYVNFGEDISNKKIYYHSGFDIGGAEGLDTVISATDGIVVSAGNIILDGYNDFPDGTRADVVYVIDPRGWYFRYSHLDSIFPEIRPGVKVKMGRRMGLIGKKGAIGGWVHLHFEIKNKDTFSGLWGTEDAYAYTWEAYAGQYNPPLIAVARPHHLVWAGDEVFFDGRKSKSFAGDSLSYEWEFSDGTVDRFPVCQKKYDKPGEYSEILKVTDAKGNVDYDFSVVQVFDKANPGNNIPTIQASFFPSLNIKPETPVTFLVRTFNSKTGNEVWDFGDGSPVATTKSDFVIRKDSSKGKFAQTIHSYSKPGIYIVSVERGNEFGYKAITHLKVEVKE